MSWKPVWLYESTETVALVVYAVAGHLLARIRYGLLNVIVAPGDDAAPVAMPHWRSTPFGENSQPCAMLAEPSRAFKALAVM